MTDDDNYRFQVERDILNSMLDKSKKEGYEQGRKDRDDKLKEICKEFKEKYRKSPLIYNVLWDFEKELMKE